jgi:hypothetical protein
MVSGVTPKTLKLTQKSVLWVRRGEEQRPAPRQNAPTLRRQVEHLIEHDGKERTAEQQPATEHQREHGVDDGRLDLDEGLVVQHQRQRAEDEHDDAGDE